MDHTLVDADTPNLWFEYLCDHNYVDAETTRERRQAFNDQYERGCLDVADYVRFEADIMQHDQATLLRWRDDFIQNRVAPKITKKAADWVRLHKICGETLILATASNSFLGEGVQQLLGIEHLIATELEFDGERYTGNIVGEPSYAAGKLSRTQQWIAQHGGDLATTTFYSDSHNDLALLRAVKTPIAVDPDPQLLAEAEANDWKIVSKY